VGARLLTSHYEGLVNGSGDESVTMKYVKRYARSNIRYGDIVVTSGMKSLYPSGIFIGAVKAIHAREYDTSLELELEPVIDFSRLEYVFVLKGEVD
jgi:rod shape-determining protein MreC